LCDSSHRPDWNGAAAVSSAGIPAVAERTAASTQPEEITGATDANEASPHIGRLERHRAGSGRASAKNPTPHPSAFIRPQR
jgi:hypothetical protein